jgi:hypothetical protein
LRCCDDAVGERGKAFFSALDGDERFGVLLAGDGRFGWVVGAGAMRP